MDHMVAKTGLSSGWSSHKKGMLRLSIAGVFLIVASINWGGSAQAGTYGIQSYGGCTYQINCPAVTNNVSSSTSASVKTPAASSNSDSPEPTRASTPDEENTNNIIDLKDYGTSNNKAFDLVNATVNQIYTIKMPTTAGTTEVHTLLINNITATAVEITLASTPQHFTLAIGQEITADLNDDKQVDLRILLQSITGSSVDLKIWPVVTTPANGSAQPKSWAKNVAVVVIRMVAAGGAVALSVFEFVVIGSKH